MSDRRRTPPYSDDWDADLEIGGSNRSSRSRNPQPERRPPPPADAHGQYPSNDYSEGDPYDAFAPKRTRPPEFEPDQYQSPFPGQGDYSVQSSDPRRQNAPITDTPSPSRPPRRAPAPDPPLEPDYYPDPRTTGQAPPIDPRQTYGRGTVEYEDDYVAPAARHRQPRTVRRAKPRKAIAVPRPALNDGLALGLVGLSLLGIVLMIATIAAGAGDLPEWLPLHLDAAGDPSQWGNTDVLWRVPFGAMMALLMAIGIAAVLWKRDRFAARFTIAGTVVVQLLAWVALIDQIW
ncbi:hypothetical protein BH23CHL5_BH23CHL5_12310 [soil metagenome]